MKRTIKCKYCGELVEGEPYDFTKSSNPTVRKEAKALKTIHKTAEISGAVGSILKLDLLQAEKFLAGTVSNKVDEIIHKVGGGTLFHFECKNCGQSFDKTVL